MTLIWPGYIISSSILRAMSWLSSRAWSSVVFSASSDDAHLAAGLDGEGVGDALEGVGDALQVLQALDVGLQHLAAGTGARPGEGVGGLHQDRQHRLGRDILVVGLDGVDDMGLFAVAPGQVGADDGVGTLHLVVHGLADIVQEAGAAGVLGVDAQLAGHDAAEEGHLQGVLQHVLGVGGAVVQPADNLDYILVDAVHAHVEGGLLAGLLDTGLHLGGAPS